jgi:hypothetical protein
MMVTIVQQNFHDIFATLNMVQLSPSFAAFKHAKMTYLKNENTPSIFMAEIPWKKEWG